MGVSVAENSAVPRMRFIVRESLCVGFQHHSRTRQRLPSGSISVLYVSSSNSPDTRRNADTAKYSSNRSE